MRSTENEQEVKAIVYGAITSSFGFPIDAITDDTTTSDVDGWDSVSTSLLFFTIEDGVGVELPIDDLLLSRNVGELVSKIFKFVTSRSRP